MKVHQGIWRAISNLCQISALGIASSSILHDLGATRLIFAQGRAEAAAQIAAGVQTAAILHNPGAIMPCLFGQSAAAVGLIAIGLSWMPGLALLGVLTGLVGGLGEDMPAVGEL